MEAKCPEQVEESLNRLVAVERKIYMPDVTEAAPIGFPSMVEQMIGVLEDVRTMNEIDLHDDSDSE